MIILLKLGLTGYSNLAANKIATVANNTRFALLAFVVIFIPLPAASVKVSAAQSATTSLCPDTAIVLKASEATPPVEDVIVNVPAASS